MDFKTIIYDRFEYVKNNIYSITPKIITSIIIFILFLTIAKYYKSYITNLGLKKTDILVDESKILEETTPNVNSIAYKQNIIYYELGYIIYYLIIGAGIIFAITNLGIDSSTILTILGTFGLAIGLALQGTLTNITSGIYIGLNELYTIGDTIKINGITGKVEEFTLFNTIIRNDSKSNIIIPNNIIQNNILINYTP